MRKFLGCRSLMTSLATAVVFIVEMCEEDF